MKYVTFIHFQNEPENATYIKRVDATRAINQIMVNDMATQLGRLAIASRPSWFSSLFGAFANYAAISRQRHALSQLDDRLLQDIGLTQTEAKSEADRAPWDVPAHWRV
ncbi:DUF1127 domain-containing protein [Donghicola eburneus]|uniref:DUF1127 domain-containing protein n=1 Tax=Donghicola eburneus TaxID=393278 RepID=UPI0008EDE894|nr:DUF1127 domain-containing protein [Donghicola eburneus]SFQ29443.1 Uncharacterized conserved protein YjiS, DUF1127 family [Donghicola eburneus]